MTSGHGALLGVLAVLPAVLLVRYFHTRDPHPRGKRFTRVVFYGGIALLVAVGPVFLWGSRRLLDWAVFGLLDVPPDPAAIALVNSLLMVALPEESLKLLVLLAIAGHRRLFSQRADGLAYGAMVALGFAVLENVAYVANGELKVAMMRTVTAVPAHAVFGAILGYYLAQAMRPGRRRLIWQGLAFAVVLHATYDFPLMGLNEATRLPYAPLSSMDVWVALALTVPAAVVMLGAVWVWFALHDLEEPHSVAAASLR
jgi:RsiW-degrading membrane proteinase PrsW (M82 family)